LSILRRVEELWSRNSAYWHRNFGIRCACVVKPLRVEHSQVSAKRPFRLFIKNTALCQHVSGSIGCDACPVLEG